MICIFIKNTNDIYKMFFFPIESTALFKAKLNLYHPHDLSWEAGTWAFSISSDIVTYFFNSA